MTPFLRPTDRVFSLGVLGLGLLVATMVSGEAKAADGEQPVCQPAMFDNQCKTNLAKKPVDLRRDHAEADGVLFNYFLVTQPSRYRELRAFSSLPSKELEQRALKLADEVRKSAIRYAAQGEDEKSWSPEKSAIVQRLRTVRFRTADALDPECFAIADPGVPNATYVAATHTISICPGAVKSASQYIAATLAHELGHTTSPCALSKNLVKLSKPDEQASHCLIQGKALDEAGEDIIGLPFVVQKPSSDYMVEMNPEENDSLIQCGVAERLPGSLQKDISFYRQFNRCMDSANTAPKAPTSTGKDICQRKRDEQFADTFGSFVYADWGTGKNLSPQQARTGLHDLTTLRCVEKEFKRPITNQKQYIKNDQRLELAMRPKAIADLLQCTPAQQYSPAPASALCALSETTFAPVGAAPSTPSSPKPLREWGPIQ